MPSTESTQEKEFILKSPETHFCQSLRGKLGQPLTRRLPSSATAHFMPPLPPLDLLSFQACHIESTSGQQIFKNTPGPELCRMKDRVGRPVMSGRGKGRRGGESSTQNGCRRHSPRRGIQTGRAKTWRTNGNWLGLRHREGCAKHREQYMQKPEEGPGE